MRFQSPFFVWVEKCGWQREELSFFKSSLFFQETVLVHLRLYLLCKNLQSLAKFCHKLIVMFVLAACVHFALVVHTLEIQANVVEGCISDGFGLFVIISPQSLSCLHHGLCLRAECDRSIRLLGSNGSSGAGLTR